MAQETHESTTETVGGFRSSISSSRSSATSALPSWQTHALKNLEVSCASLQRGVPSAIALRNFASVFSDRAPTEQDFERSVPVEALDVFVSHNWSSSRWRKFLVLAFHFNLYRSLFISFLVAAATSVMMHFGILPISTATTAVARDGAPYSRGFLAFPLGMLTFVVCLLFSHELDRLPYSPFKRQMLWLDRMCVHQTQPDKKREGIQSLAAFLARSQDIMICYSDVYMTKLWTVYEVSSWLMLHRGKRILLRPLRVPIVLLGGLFTFTVLEVVVCVIVFLNLSTDFEIPPAVGIALNLLFVYPCCTSATWLGAKLAQERERIVEHVQAFRLSDAKCADEADRRVVQQNIVAFMKLSKLCEPDAEDEQVFGAFETLVRTDVPALMRSSFGRVGVPYWGTAVFFLPRSLVYFDHIVGQLRDGRPWSSILLQFVANQVFVFAFLPLLVALMLLATRTPRLRTAPAISATGALATTSLFAFIIITLQMVSKALESNLWLAALLLACAALSASAFAAYRP